MGRYRPSWMVVAALLASAALAPAQDLPEPALLQLPAGVEARLFTRALPNQRVEGVLLRADASEVSILPAGDLLVGTELTVPANDVIRLELALEKKRHWWQGLLIGAAAGALLGLGDDVDPALCELNENVSCSRGEAIADYALGGAAVGVAIGAFVRTDRWTPVALEALAPPAPRAARSGPVVRAVRGGMALGYAIRF